mgnify:CR=1 FL=1
MAGGLPHGSGVMQRRDGRTVTGKMYNGLWQGDTLWQWAGGDRQRGRMEKKKWQGLVETFRADGHWHHECLRDDQKHGLSYSVTKSGSEHERMFKMCDMGVQTGLSLWMNPNTDRVEVGRYRRGQKVGEERVYSSGGEGGGK